MSDELETLKTVAQRLESAHISYMLTGSVAMSFYAMPRMTRDIDIVIELKREDIARLYDVFKSDFYVDEEMIREALRDRGMFNVIHNGSGVKVDFVVRKLEIFRKTEFERRRKVSLEGFDVWLVSAEDLILSKLHWAKDSQSEIQLRDIQNLLGGACEINTEYLEKWAKDLGVYQLYEKVKP